MTWRDLSYEGNRDIRTPHLDRLRTQGMHLRRMFTPATTRRLLDAWMTQQGDQGMAAELKAHSRQSRGRTPRNRPQGNTQ